MSTEKTVWFRKFYFLKSNVVTFKNRLIVDASFHASILLLIMSFVTDIAMIVKLGVDPHGEWIHRLLWHCYDKIQSITGHTHEKLKKKTDVNLFFLQLYQIVRSCSLCEHGINYTFMCLSAF